MNSHCMCLVVLNLKKHCVYKYSLNFRRKKIPYQDKDWRYDNLSLMITKWSLNVQRYNGKFTHWLASLCGGCRPERMKGGEIRSLVCWPILSQQKVCLLSCFPTAFFVKWIGDTRVIIYPQFISDTALYRDSIRVSMEIAI